MVRKKVALFLVAGSALVGAVYLVTTYVLREYRKDWWTSAQ